MELANGERISAVISLLLMNIQSAQAAATANTVVIQHTIDLPLSKFTWTAAGNICYNQFFSFSDQCVFVRRVQIFLKGNNVDHLSMYLDVLDSSNLLDGWSKYSEFSLSVVDQVIVDCNALSVDIENEIVIVHNFVWDNYRLKFLELEYLVHHPIDYARVVKKIGNETNLTLVDLEGLLPSAIIMVVSVTASTTSGKPLPEEKLKKTLDAYDRALALDLAKKKVLDFVESRMGYISPNLSTIVGSVVAAKLMGSAGGLSL
ncbi:hypothetical protein IFM89_039485 [Coptis chinensis]|uniref:Nop domain-containing protein n=1 Tax=Coptis chinensis TaxID=261450 RepID=A0A835LL32_9MAGN|nr:hypothetical protein IFM89_039485 [Coptis chinensis]